MNAAQPFETMPGPRALYAGGGGLIMLYVVFVALDGRELYACPAADMLPEEKRATKWDLANEYGLRPREIYITHAMR